MNWKKTGIQIVACLIISAVIWCARHNDIAYNSTAYQTVSKMISHNLSINEVLTIGNLCTEKLKKAPSVLTSELIRVNSYSKYGEPVDEASNESVKQVYSVAGGMVLKVGKNDEKGLYIVIKHEDSTSVYGNLEDVKVFPDKRVQRGEIIATYNNANHKDFYYELIPDV